MWDFWLGCFSIAWKIIGLIAGWYIFKYVIRDGRYTIREMIETLKIGIQTGNMKLRSWLFKQMRKEAAKQETTTE